MPSFPLIKELPPVLDSTGWSWDIFHAPPSDFWLGTDLDGNRWLTKLRGGFCAYREIVFARLAQEMGWFCQSSAFLKLDKSSAKTLGVSASEIHAANWFMEEHQHSACTPDCPRKLLNDRPPETIDDLSNFQIKHLIDWPKSELAALLFGANDGPDGLFTRQHEFVVIDSEQMFASGPSDISSWRWWNQRDGAPSRSGHALALEVCREVSALTSAEVEEALSIPRGVSVRQQRTIAPKLKASRKFAVEYIASHGKD